MLMIFKILIDIYYFVLFDIVWFDSNSILIFEYFVLISKCFVIEIFVVIRYLKYKLKNI